MSYRYFTLNFRWWRRRRFSSNGWPSLNPSLKPHAPSRRHLYVIILFIIMIIMHYYKLYFLCTNNVRRRATSNGWPQPQTQFPTVLYVIITSKLFLLLLLLLTIYHDLWMYFITNVRDARQAPASNPSAVTPSRTWVSCPSVSCQKWQRDCPNCQCAGKFGGWLGSSVGIAVHTPLLTVVNDGDVIGHKDEWHRVTKE